MTTTSVHVGTDLVCVPSIEASLQCFGDRFVRRVFTEAEGRYAQEAPSLTAQRLAARLAAKEATIKVLCPEGVAVPWTSVEVERRPSGACALRLHGLAAELARSRGFRSFSVSLSHEQELATAVVLGEREGPDDQGPSGLNETPSHRLWCRTTEGHSSMLIDDIRAVLKEHGRLSVNIDGLSEKDDLYQAGMTSHASVNVMLAIEGRFDVEFPDTMLKRSVFESIGAIREAVEELTGGTA